MDPDHSLLLAEDILGIAEVDENENSGSDEQELSTIELVRVDQDQDNGEDETERKPTASLPILSQNTVEQISRPHSRRQPAPACRMSFHWSRRQQRDQDVIKGRATRSKPPKTMQTELTSFFDTWVSPTKEEGPKNILKILDQV